MIGKISLVPQQASKQASHSISLNVPFPSILHRNTHLPTYLGNDTEWKRKPACNSAHQSRRKEVATASRKRTGERKLSDLCVTSPRKQIQ
jgi:hypothetical protein